jgi:NADPH:quinone reductase-like Zn-dependent oxidoreductase
LSFCPVFRSKHYILNFQCDDSSQTCSAVARLVCGNIAGRDKGEENMRAYQLPKGGAGIDALVQLDRPDPKPAYRQVLVKVRACSLNFRDLGIVRGTYRMPVRENVIPLSDGAGEVIEVGPGVTRAKVGDRVAGCFFQRWFGGEAPPDVQASALGGGIDGMLAEYAVLEEDGIVKIPQHLSLEEGATLPCAGVTIWNAMIEHAKLVAGQTVLLQGTGGVSIFGLQLARAMGIQVIITSSSDIKLARAKTLGANYGINYKVIPDWEKAAMEFTGGRGVDHVVEVGGSATLARSFGAIHVGGKISMIGGLSGPATELNPGMILARRANVQGISVGSTQMFAAMTRAIEASAIKPIVDRVFAFQEAPAAYRHMASGAHFGKIVIHVA